MVMSTRKLRQKNGAMHFARVPGWKRGAVVNAWVCNLEVQCSYSPSGWVCAATWPQGPEDGNSVGGTRSAVAIQA